MYNDVLCVIVFFSLMLCFLPATGFSQMVSCLRVLWWPMCVTAKGHDKQEHCDAHYIILLNVNIILCVKLSYQ
jgi:hypothetical protein